MTSSPWRAACRLRMVIAVALAVMALSLAPAAGTTFAQSTLYPGAVGLVANTGGDPVLLRETPSFDAAVLSSFPEGTPADILEGPVYSADGVAWHGVSVGGVTGYIVAGYLIENGQAAAPVELAQEAGPVAMAQEAVPVTEATEMASTEPAPVETAPAEALPVPPASPGEVPLNPITTADLNLRAGPSFGDAVLLVIPAGAALAPTGEWSQGFVGVTYEGNYGWVDGAWLAAGEPVQATSKDVALMQVADPAPVTTAEAAPTKDAAFTAAPAATTAGPAYATDLANLRAGPSESTEVLRVLPEGGPVTITGASSGGWTPVWYNGTSGYIRSDLLSTTTTAPTATDPAVSLAQEVAPVADSLAAAAPVTESGTGELAATTLRNVNLRGGPAMTAPVMGTIPPGTTLTTLAGPEQGFYQVQYGEQVG
ncbi:MAG: SH3 domain-containing protein, partial [Chloroflexi bacterium]|nr:SH3 domain-containing protein [Chloroflexota bacterium]